MKNTFLFKPLIGNFHLGVVSACLQKRNLCAIVYTTTAMAERRDSSDSRSESGDFDTTRTSTILSSSSYEYIDSEGSATIESYQFQHKNEADGQDSASTGDDVDEHENNLQLGNTHW